MSDALDDAIETSAGQLLKGSTDGMAGEQHPLSEQIEAARFIDAQRAAKSGRTGIRKRQIVHSNPSYS